MKRNQSRRIHWIVTIFALTACLTSGITKAAVLEYSMTWNSLNGTYDGNSFTGQSVTFRFLNVDTDVDIVSVSWMPTWNQIRFLNGADVRVSVGNLLSDGAMDDSPTNDVMLLSTGTSIGMGEGDHAGNYLSDRGYVASFSTPPSPQTPLSQLTSIWSSTASGEMMGWGKPFQIGGKYLHVGDTQTTTGTWAVIPEPGSIVLMGLFLIATPLLFLRRKHRFAP